LQFRRTVVDRVSKHGTVETNVVTRSRVEAKMVFVFPLRKHVKYSVSPP